MRDALAPAFYRDLVGRTVQTSDSTAFTSDNICFDPIGYNDSLFEYTIKQEDVRLFDIDQLVYDTWDGTLGHPINTEELEKLVVDKFYDAICSGCGLHYDSCECCPDCGVYYRNCECESENEDED